MLAQKAEAKNLSLTFTCGPGVPDVVTGDAKRLTQILINLVDNAIKFTKHGSVDVSAYLLSENEEHCEVQFFVKDTGIGISDDKLQKVFERFEQAELNTTRNYGGTGLGLSIAKQLVDLQGGEMHIKSAINEGTEFSFTLPFKKSKNEFPVNLISPIKEFDISELSKYRILLAEDSAISVKLILSLFSRYNIKVDVAENGKQAVDKIAKGHYDLVLMDMEMPEMNGYEATSILRNEMHNSIPIIAMTAHAMAGEMDKCLKLGMNDYIPKPINAKLLFEKIYNNIKVSNKTKV
jgi:CheY-like chemotaxis protein/anti-sigma regulatory factor (Ser/Thr protein kinase)